MGNFNSGICNDISLRKYRIVYVTPPEHTISGSNNSIIDSVMFALSLSEWVPIELANITMNAMMAFNSFICTSFSVSCFFRWISFDFNNGLFLSDSISVLEYVTKSLLELVNANDMKPVQNMSSLLSVPKQNDEFESTRLIGIWDPVGLLFALRLTPVTDCCCCSVRLEADPDVGVPLVAPLGFDEDDEPEPDELRKNGVLVLSAERNLRVSGKYSLLN